jgi:hypothetical protein
MEVSKRARWVSWMEVERSVRRERVMAREVVWMVMESRRVVACVGRSWGREGSGDARVARSWAVCIRLVEIAVAI